TGPRFHTLPASGCRARRRLRVLRARDRRPHQEHPQEDRTAVHRDRVRRRLPLRRADRMMRYRRRPPWWPENEPFPPTRRWGRGYGPPPFVRWIGCFVLTLFGVSLLAGGLAGAIFGRGGGFGVHPFFLIPIFVVIALVALGVFGGVRRMAQPMNNLIEA